ncbi:DUF2917 domain-containing protein [Ramlibacter sp. MAHUQ-53]|uniref:DUF2917 domain-containing protein n=1 Tax=unclassified Ramlibacter TaxID=2617605 RepID=UPI00363200AE
MSAHDFLQTLPPGRPLTLRAAAGTVLRVLRGRVWLTRSGDAADHFLQAGEALRLDGARTVVEADRGEAARFVLEAPQAATAAAPPRQAAARPSASQASASSSTSTQCRTGVSVPL